MFESITNFFKNFGKSDKKDNNSKDTARERLHLVLMQDRANISADFIDLMRQEIIEVIKKYVDIDEREIDVRMTNEQNDDGSNGTPSLYANIPIINIKNDILVEKKKEAEKAKNEEQSENSEEIKQEGEQIQDGNQENNSENNNEVHVENSGENNEPHDEQRTLETMNQN